MTPGYAETMGTRPIRIAFVGDSITAGARVSRKLPCQVQDRLARAGHAALAFNDAWVERASGQTAWVKASVGSGVAFEM